MLQTLDTNREFEALVRPYLAANPRIRCEWRQIRGVVSGGRTDLICYTDRGAEVFASLSRVQITVGCGGESTDFEDFGRGLSDAAVAKEAFEKFVRLLQGERT